MFVLVIRSVSFVLVLTAFVVTERTESGPQQKWNRVLSSAAGRGAGFAEIREKTARLEQSQDFGSWRERVCPNVVLQWLLLQKTDE